MIQKGSHRTGETRLKKYLSFYFVISLVLSFTIILRLVVTTFDNEAISFFKAVGFFNVVFYDLYYYLLPVIVVVLWFTSTDRSLEKGVNWKFVGIIVLPVVLIFIDYCVNIIVFYFIPPAIVVSILYFKYWKKLSTPTFFSKKTLIIILLGIFLMPYLSVLFGLTNTSLTMNTLQDDYEKIEYISNYVMDAHTSFWGSGSAYYSPHRVGDNFLKFWLVGVCGCGDMAYSTISFIDFLDLKSRPVGFPGEDHMFVEVFLDGNWLVVDPGYNLTLITQKERAFARIKEIGGLSYVVANSKNDPIDLTEIYVNTDKIIIKILDNGNPVTDAKVTLKHTFHGSTFSLPSFYSDNNGTVILSLGPMSYSNPNIEPAEQFYWVYVNEKNTNIQITSSGSGKSTLVEVNLNVD